MARQIHDADNLFRQESAKDRRALCQVRLTEAEELAAFKKAQAANRPAKKRRLHACVDDEAEEVGQEECEREEMESEAAARAEECEEDEDDEEDVDALSARMGALAPNA